MIIASASEAVMDALSHGFEQSIFKNLNPMWWDPKQSGVNKWKDGDRNKGEKFFLSSTLLVGFTEGWHLFKMIRTFTLFLSITFASYGVHIITELNLLTTIIIFILTRVLFGLSFTLFYKIFINK